MSGVEISDDAVSVDWGGGVLLVKPDGSICVVVDDDYYNGQIEPAHALQLAEAIRVRVRARSLELGTTERPPT